MSETVATSSAPVLPSTKTLAHASKLAIEEDRPILLDYYVDTYTNAAFLGENAETNEKVLVKNSEEYTSPISRIFRVDNDYIVLTENSLYIVSCNIKKRRIE